ncbi:MAG: D-alanine--D-alanine ligase [Candidatus Vogelbacteria bacterium]|nr:D-alanine--D-alanine ligase [Candidatus Vogelbacteria bacterium]
MSRIKVAVLRGGPSGEYEVSLQSGATVLKNLPEKYEPFDVWIDRQSNWHRGGIAMKANEALRHIDVVFNALHGEYGEDGKVQRDLDQLDIPYTGAESLPSAIGMNKILSKERFKQAGIKTPVYKVLEVTDDLEDQIVELFRTFPHPAVVKPATSGSSLGVSIVQTLSELRAGVKNAFQHARKVLIEEYIKGKEATCGVVDNFRGADVYALLPVEIVPNDGRFFDYEAKYQGKSQEICPPKSFTHDEKRQLETLAAQVHKVLGLRHYSRTDFIVSPKRGIYVLEVNTLPGLTSESLLPKSLHAVGMKLPDFFDHILTLALEKR